MDLDLIRAAETPGAQSWSAPVEELRANLEAAETAVATKTSQSHSQDELTLKLGKFKAPIHNVKTFALYFNPKQGMTNMWRRWVFRIIPDTNWIVAMASSRR